MEESQNTGTVTKDDSFQILQKVEDMIDYAYPLIKRWSVADKYAIGNDLMDCMKKTVSMGIPLEAAVRSSSYNPACSIGISGRLGSIAIGKQADCVLLDCNTLDIRAVIKAGRLISAADSM